MRALSAEAAGKKFGTRQETHFMKRLKACNAAPCGRASDCL